MIKKLTGKAGMSLIEMMASLLILVLLVVGMNAGMTAGLRVYQESKVAADRTMLASNINTRLTDILRYAEVKEANGQDLITNLEYGLWDVTFDEDEDGKVQVCFWDKTGRQLAKRTPLINSGNYSGFAVSDLNVAYETDDKGGYFAISYKLINTGDNSSSDLIEAIVRVMNE